jgi:DNA-binding transcriptional LysR family regulator
MTLTQLRYLAAIVDAGLNITVAARIVGATQPGLSKQLRQLEDELGAELFQRRGKSLEALTPVGAEVLEHSRVVLAEAGAIRALAADRRGAAGAPLRIAASHTQARFVLAQALGEVRARFPKVRIDVFASPETEALQRLTGEAADVALVSSPEAPRTNALALPLYRWRLRAIVHRDHALAYGAPALTLAELARWPMVTYDWGRDPASSFARRFHEAGLAPTIACTAADAELIKGYVRAGLGVGVVAEMAVSERDDDLIALDLPPEFGGRTAWAIVRREHARRAPVLALLAALAPHLDRAALQSDRPVPQDHQPPTWRDRDITGAGSNQIRASA